MNNISVKLSRYIILRDSRISARIFKRFYTNEAAPHTIRFPSRELSKLLQAMKFEETVAFLFRLKPYHVINETMLIEASTKLFEYGRSGSISENKKANSAAIALLDNWGNFLPNKEPSHSLKENYCRAVCNIKGVQEGIVHYERFAQSGSSPSTALMRFFVEKLTPCKMNRDIIYFSTEALFVRRIMDSSQTSSSDIELFWSAYIAAMSEFGRFSELRDRIMSILASGKGKHVANISEAMTRVMTTYASQRGFKGCKLYDISEELGINITVAAKCSVLSALISSGESGFDLFNRIIAQDKSIVRGLEAPGECDSDLLACAISGLSLSDPMKFADNWRRWQNNNYELITSIIGRKDKIVLSGILTI